MSRISKAEEDPRVQQLLAQVNANYTIHYRRSQTDGWGSNVCGSVAEIYHAETGHPSAALAHELLHVIVQIRGYRRIRGGAALNIEPSRLKRIIDCLDNELQHHKMYPRFVQLEFKPAGFYADDDFQAYEYLEQALAAPVRDVWDILPDYFTLLAPGGSMSVSQQQELDQRFASLAGGRFAQQLSAVRSAVAPWASSESYDAEETLRTIFLALESPCYVWLGHSRTTSSANDGFFIDRTFDVLQPPRSR